MTFTTIEASSFRKRLHDAAFSPTSSPSKYARIDDSSKTLNVKENFVISSELVITEEPLSLSQRIAARELGLVRNVFDPWDYLESGERLLEKGRAEEAKKYLDIIKAQFNPSIQRDLQCLLNVFALEYNYQFFNEAIETHQLWAQDSFDRTSLGLLTMALCYAQLGNSRKLFSNFEEFGERWCKWTVLNPSSCPKNFRAYFDEMDELIDVVLLIIEKEKKRENCFDFYSIVAWLNFIREDYEGAYWVAKEFKNGHPNHRDGLLLQHLCILKSEDLGSKEEVFAFLAREPNLEITENPFSWLPWKLLLEEGLKTLDHRPLNLALRRFLEVQTTDFHENPHYQGDLFACYFALGDYDKALDLTHQMEPDRVLLQRTLCHLSRVTQMEPEIVENLQKVLQEKLEEDPVFLHFVGNYLVRRSSELSASLPSEDFFTWAASFPSACKNL